MGDQLHSESTCGFEGLNGVCWFRGRNRFEVFFKSRFISGDIHEFPITVFGSVVGPVAAGEKEAQAWTDDELLDRTPVFFLRWK